MAGDPNNAALWADADVFIAPPGTDKPADADTDFGPDWGLVGLLDGEAGFGHSRAEEKADHYAWGGVLVRSSRRNFKQTVTFTALEDNETTRSLIWPGSSPTRLIVPRPKPILLALEKREDEKVHRLFTERHAIVELNGDVTESEQDLTKYPLLGTIFPTASGGLWIVQETEDEDDGA